MPTQTPTQTPTLDEIGITLAREFGPRVASAVMAACSVAREDWVWDDTDAMRSISGHAHAYLHTLRAICDRQ